MQARKQNESQSLVSPAESPLPVTIPNHDAGSTDTGEKRESLMIGEENKRIRQKWSRHLVYYRETRKIEEKQ